MDGILVVDGEKSGPVVLGGYKITLSAGMGFGAPAAKPDSGTELGGGVSLEWRTLRAISGPSPL